MRYGKPLRWVLVALVHAVWAPAGGRAEVVDNEPPGIIHVPVAEAKVRQAVEITATITDKSGVFEPTLFFRGAGATKFTSSGMSGKGDVYVATIPAPVVTADVEYFIEAFDTPGNGPARFASSDAPQRIAVTKAPEVASPETAKPAAPPAATILDLPTPAAPGSGMKLAGYGLLGAGGVAGVVGAILGLSASSQYDKAKAATSARSASDLFTGAESKGTAANVSLVLAGVLASGGAVLLVLGRQEPAEQGISMTVSPAVFGLAAAGSF